MCGLFSYRICSGAPNFTKVSRTNRFLPVGSLTSVFNLPSEKSSCAALSELHVGNRIQHSALPERSTSFLRSVTERPRSRTTGAQPLIVSAYAQKSPQDPHRQSPAGWTALAKPLPADNNRSAYDRNIRIVCPFMIFSSPEVETSTEYTNDSSGLFLASMDFLIIR